MFNVRAVCFFVYGRFFGSHGVPRRIAWFVDYPLFAGPEAATWVEVRRGIFKLGSTSGPTLWPTHLPAPPAPAAAPAV